MKNLFIFSIVILPVLSSASPSNFTSSDSLGYENFFQSLPPFNRWYMGMEYTTGLAPASAQLKKSNPFNSNAMDFINFASLELIFYYSTIPGYYILDSKNVVGFSTGYMLANPWERQTNISIPDGFSSCKNVNWNISILPVTFRFLKINKEIFWGIGVEYYYCNAVDKVIAENYNEYFEPTGSKTFAIRSRGYGFGWHIKMGLKPWGSEKFRTTFSLTLRGGEINENWNDASPEMKWTPVKIKVTGIYLNAGFEYFLP